MNVIKRDGSVVPKNLDKFHKMIEWIADDLPGVSVSEIEMNSSIQFSDNMKTTDIHKIATKSCKDLISLKNHNYQYAAARSLLMEVRKDVFGKFEPDSLLSMIKKNIKLGHYENILEYYTTDEINTLDSKINHKKDFKYTYAGLRTMVDSYTIKSVNRLIESPQHINMLVAMVMFKNDENREQQVTQYYNDLSDFVISLPSPFMSGLRTKVKGYASCCLIDSGDSRDSLTAANAASIVMSTVRAGIGLFNGNIRGINAWVASKTIKHTGIVQILKWMQAAVKAFAQPSRGGAATSYHACWNWEIEKIINLKSNKSTDENSVRGLDYGIGFTSLFLERVKKNESWTLFSAEETRELFDNLNNQELWEQTYIKYEKKSGIRKKKVNARELFKDWAVQYFETGRIYPLFLTNANNGPLKDPIKMSNLCAEILLSVKELQYLHDPDGEIALCILANINAGKIKSFNKFEHLAYQIVKGFDNIIDIQDYPLPAAKNSTENNRYVGVGVSDWAHYLTKHKVKYDSQEALDLAEEFMERWQFALLQASNRLAKERGEAPNFRTKSKYSDGWLPNDGKWRFIPKKDWEELRTNIVTDGLRNLVLSALPPAATSSDLSGSTSSIDMPRDLLTTKLSKTGPVPQIVPNFSKGSSYYTLANELDNISYLNMISKFQLYTDQGISTNLYWSKKDFIDDKFPIGKLIKTVIHAEKIGLKTLYYCNFLSDDVETEDAGCAGGGCSI